MSLTPEQLAWWTDEYRSIPSLAIPADQYHWDADRWPNFTPHEVACRGTGLLFIDHQAMDALQRFRHLIGIPFSPNSAFRTKDHNKAIGGKQHSMHLLGIAFDIPKIDTTERMVKVAKAAGFNGIGTYRWGVHMDTRPWKARW